MFSLEVLLSCGMLALVIVQWHDIGVTFYLPGLSSWIQDGL
jgi:hypothetical protein